MSSSLIVEVCKIDNIEPHSNADAIELALVKGWQVIVKKGQYQGGEKIIFIPPDALLPTEWAEELGIRNYLTGANRDRVKTVRLRGEMSFGLVVTIPEGKDWDVGYDCVEDLGILKYEPPVRAQAGDSAPEDPFFPRYTDIENARNFPEIFEEGEEVIATEKIDGSNCRLGLSVTVKDTGEEIIEWKAGSHKLKRKMPEEDIEKHTYWYPYTLDCVKNMVETMRDNGDYKEFILYGEIYGAVRGGHKSLHYGKPNSLNFAAFDIRIDGHYIDSSTFFSICDFYGVPTVPIVEKFKFSFDKAKEVATGESLLAAKNGTIHMREGVVIKPIKEKRHPKIGRTILKMLNDDYIILKNKAYDKGEVTDFTDE